jgi:hypothetical protein
MPICAVSLAVPASPVTSELPIGSLRIVPRNGFPAGSTPPNSNTQYAPHWHAIYFVGRLLVRSVSRIKHPFLTKLKS